MIMSLWKRKRSGSPVQLFTHKNSSLRTGVRELKFSSVQFSSCAEQQTVNRSIDWLQTAPPVQVYRYGAGVFDAAVLQSPRRYVRPAIERWMPRCWRWAPQFHPYQRRCRTAAVWWWAETTDDAVGTDRAPVDLSQALTYYTVIGCGSS